MISKHTIQKINDQVRVEEVVGEFVTLKKRGANYLGLCPFHTEKTPSFNVNPVRGIYKCFGCGKAGGPVQFLMEYQQLSYPDALRYIAKKYQIEIDEEKQTDEEKQREQEEHQTAESIFIANSAAQKYFTDYMLHNENGKVGLAYLKERGFLMHTIEKFQLGFAPDGWDTFTSHALQSGFSLDVLQKAGLTRAEENKKPIDFFRNRVMFPVHNLTGKIVGFGGRIMVKDAKAPKYINTSESAVYQKSRLLYGFYFAKAEMRKKDECFLVEGYTDVISLAQAGIENAVASSGTSLTVEQIRAINRITNNITMLYDGDAAGIKAALRGTDLILEEGMNVRVVVLPDGDDPDSFIRKTGADGFLDFVKANKKDLILFKAGLFAADAHDPMLKAQFLRNLAESMAKIPDGIQRSVYVREASQLYDINEQVLITEVNKLRRKKKQAPAGEENKPEEAQQAEATEYKAEKQSDPFTSIQPTERDIIRVLLEFGTNDMATENGPVKVAQYVMDELEGVTLETPGYRALFDLYKQEASRNLPDAKFFLHHEDAAIAATAMDLLAEPHTISELWLNKFGIVTPTKNDVMMHDIHSAIVRLKQVHNIRELQKITRMISECKDEAQQQKLLKAQMILTREKTRLAKEVGNVIYRPLN